MRFLKEQLDQVIYKFDKYISLHSTEERPVLQNLNRYTHENIQDPQFIAGHVQGNFLSMISRMLNPKCILEIGTFTGYSAICFADGLVKGGKIHTIELNKELWNISEEYWIESGLDNVISLYKGNAIDIIPTINEIFDLVYIDANKIESCEYYDLVFDKVRKGGFILCDNALWYGRVLNSDMDKEAQGVHLLNEKIQSDPRTFNVIVSIRDGVMLAQKIA